MLKNCTTAGTKLLKAPSPDAAPALIKLPNKTRSAGFALKLSHFSSFSNLGISLASFAVSGSCAASTAAARHSAALGEEWSSWVVDLLFAVEMCCCWGPFLCPAQLGSFSVWCCFVVLCFAVEMGCCSLCCVLASGMKWPLLDCN